MNILKYLDKDTKEYYIELKFNTPYLVSVNEMYKINKVGAVYKTEKAFEYQEYIVSQIEPSIVEYLKTYDLYKEFFENLISYEIYLEVIRSPSGWLHKNGKLKKVDISNCIKALEDAIVKSLNLGNTENVIDDSLCTGLIVTKLVDENLYENDIHFRCILKLFMRDD